MIDDASKLSYCFFLPPHPSSVSEPAAAAAVIARHMEGQLLGDRGQAAIWGWAGADQASHIVFVGAGTTTRLARGARLNRPGWRASRDDTGHGKWADRRSGPCWRKREGGGGRKDIT